MFRKWAVLLLCAAAGCASAEKRLEQGHEAEAEGRWDKAVDLYIDALRRDPEVPGGRERLRSAGNRALGQMLDLAKEFEAAGRDEQAVQEYLRADALVGRVASVRVALKRPPSYTTGRRAAFDRVIEKTLAKADRLAEEGRYDQAAALYGKSIARLEPSKQQRARSNKGRYHALVAGATDALEAGHFAGAASLADRAVAVYGADSKRAADAVVLRARIDDARYDALLVSATEHMSDGRYQAAYALTQDALAIHGPEAEASAAARELAEQVIDAGTVTVAVPPVWRRDRAVRLPAGLLDEINDLLVQEHWSHPPLFVSTLDSRSVRAELRRLGLDRRVLDDAHARTVGELMDAHFMAIASVRKCGVDRTERPEAHRVATREGPETEVQVYRRRVLVAACTIRIVRIADGRVLAEREVRAEAHTECAHAASNELPGRLRMSKAQHRWFDRRHLAEVDRELEREVAEALAAGIAETVYDEVTKHLP